MFTDREKQVIQETINIMKNIYIDNVAEKTLIDSIEWKLKHSKLWLGLDGEV